MARRALVDNATVLAWAPDSQGVDATDLTRCIAAASLFVEESLGWLLSSNEYTAFHSGGRAVSGFSGECADTLYLTDPETGLATKPVLASPALTVSENGTALTVAYLNAVGSWATGELALVNPSAGTLHRASGASGILTPKSWAAGYGNIKTVYTAGFVTSGSPTVPADIVQVVCELSWGYYREGARNGLESLAESGVNLTFVRLLSPNAKAIMQSRMVHRTPRTGLL